MKIKDLLMMSVRSLWRRKLRTSLTILGVVIGACSIILMLSLGIAMDRNFEAQLANMGSLSIIEVQSNSWGDSNAPKLDDKALETFGRIEGVQKAIPIQSTRAKLQFGKYYTEWEVNIQGMDPEDMELLDIRLGSGRFITAEDRNVIIFSNDLKERFVKKGQKFNWQNPTILEFEVETDKIKIDLSERDYMTGELATDANGNRIKAPNLITLTVIGITSERDNQLWGGAVVPTEVYNKIVKERADYYKKLGREDYSTRNNGGNKYESVKVKAYKQDEVVRIAKELEELGYYVWTPMQYLESMKETSNSIQVMLGGIGAVSLVVAAIGITNTMMMSIYERTREIGIMKVIGAKITDIKQMFLIEALLIGAIGGGVGVLFSYLLSMVINRFGGQLAGSMMMVSGENISVIPPWLAIAALIFSTLIGLISGYFPAKRAMNLSALHAIKTE
jgi:ABC-type antimicrobial peptide transport system permease subunit